ncbi:MAG: hypothetical protein ACKOA8_10985 [Deltaproteobacteria bacterium]
MSFLLGLLGFAVVSLPVFSLEIKLEEVSLKLSQGWRIHQQAKDHATELLGFENGENYLQVYVRPLAYSSSTALYDISDARVVKDYVYPVQSVLRWRIKETLKENIVASLGEARSDRFDYLVISQAKTSGVATQNLREFIQGVFPLNPQNRSLTGPDYTGKKYYVGFGDYLSGFMGNEVKYDIAHTHDIFTQEIGGSYLGSKVHGSQVGETALVQKWNELKGLMTEKDMYVQYSSGHGSHTGLAFGPTYNEIRDNALSYPAKEIIIFTMACYSGNLVNSFNQKKTVWENWQSQGRTLMVMASSRPDEESSTGPITDSEEPNGPNGSAGSAFGHSLWKALIGYADGSVDGIKDHFLSLAEIRDFTIKRTQELGGHTPVVTGAYNGNLLMVKVPSQSYIESLSHGSENLSDDQLIEKIRQLDSEWRVQ